MRKWLIILGLLMPVSLWAQTDEQYISHWKGEGWTETNFQKKQIQFSDILSGGPPRDGIPPIYKPSFESITEASTWLPDSEPVLVFQKGKEARAYPYRILIWHEIVNDVYQGQSFIVTFCPLCNSAIIFNTHFQGQNHLFGVSGKLRNSDMIMWDHTTESWWQQMTGQAVVGDATGTQLEMLPSPAISFGTYKSIFSQGKVLSQNTSFFRSYGNNPYADYENSAHPFLMKGKIDGRLPALSRVIGIEWKREFYILPLFEIANKKWGRLPIKDGKQLIFFNLSLANAALDRRSIKNSKLIDHVTIWEPPANEEEIEFYWDKNTLKDKTKQLSWNALGQGLRNGKSVEQLKPVHFGVHFSFAWLAFHPKSQFLSLQ